MGYTAKDLPTYITSDGTTTRGLSKYPTYDSAVAAGADAKKDAIEALVALGYSASEAAGAVRKLQVTEEMSVEGILKLSLKNL